MSVRISRQDRTKQIPAVESKIKIKKIPVDEEDLYWKQVFR